MINNAGLGAEGILIHELEEETWDKMMCVRPSRFSCKVLYLQSHNSFRQVNLRSVYLGCKYACAQFLRQDLGSDGQRGWIVNTASILGVVGYHNGAGTPFSAL